MVEPEHGKAVTIGWDLKANLQEKVIDFLSRNIDVFTWKLEDMPGIDPEVAVHRLNISLGAKPVKQKKRQFAPKRRVVSGKWRVCIDFTNLNKACPKDSYPLPRIDNLVDSTSGYKLYNFLDAFLGYHQILMTKEDQEKTSFMADSAIYCYRVMLFGLKNKFFADLIGKNIEAYVDDMVVKSKKVEEHISDLEEVFITLRKYKMKLNPEKCVFGVASGKFLADRCFPFFKALRDNHCFEWNGECEKAFQELKQTLESSPILTKPEPGDTLHLYLAVSQNAVSGVLVKEVNRAQQPIYYKPDVSRRLLRWAIELEEFDIEFKLRPSIKAQALADFITELTPRPRGPADRSSSSTTGVWEIFVDGASNSSGSGSGVIIISLDMLINIQCALRFEFEATNNEAEYEAVIIAVELAINLELENIKIYSDSQLVVGQIEGTFNRKDEKMSLYCLKVYDLLRKFKSCEIVKISRAENCKADALSKLVFMGIDGLDRTVHVRIVTEPSINQTIGIMDIDNEPSWMDPIVDFINMAVFQKILEQREASDPKLRGIALLKEFYFAGASHFHTSDALGLLNHSRP
ncbi:uncharacterized protein LOC111366648 [Olea europaea var. sylvestris]|uniref:uncharacterized protein LOC111366648 n=1 Tax=Olea europaea var. sylvestris TaxID=158386 RepID=UPI000C1CF003|nr:uncharacterized protein LOC111366648 [Olea europaea var. sylvestris]